MRGWGTLPRLAACTALALTVVGGTASARVRSASRATALAPGISLAATPGQIASGGTSSLAGTVTGTPAGTAVQLYASPYPYRASRLAGTGESSAPVPGACRQTRKWKRPAASVTRVRSATT